MLEICHDLRSKNPEKEVWSTVVLLLQITGKQNPGELEFSKELREKIVEQNHARFENTEWNRSVGKYCDDREAAQRRKLLEQLEADGLIPHPMKIWGKWKKPFNAEPKSLNAGVGYLKRIRFEDLKNQEATRREKIEQNVAATEKKSHKFREETRGGWWKWGI